MIIPHEVKKKPLEYLILALIFSISLLVYFFAGLEAHGRRLVVYFLAISYLIWSLHHHYRRGDLTLSVIVEYLVIALFGIFLLSATFF